MDRTDKAQGSVHRTSPSDPTDRTRRTGASFTDKPVKADGLTAAEAAKEADLR